MAIEAAIRSRTSRKPTPTLSRDDVLASIRAADDGYGVRPSQLRREVRQAAIYYFRNATRAIRQSGVRQRPANLRWTRERVIDAMKRWVVSSKPMSLTALHRAKQNALASAIERVFGSLATACEAAGLDPPHEAKPRMLTLTSRDVIDAIQGRARDGGIYVKWIAPNERRWAIRHFGSLDTAIAAADVERLDTIRWTPETIREAVRDWIRGGGAVTQHAMRAGGLTTLTSAILRRYGSIATFRQALDVAVSAPRRRRATWSK